MSIGTGTDLGGTGLGGVGVGGSGPGDQPGAGPLPPPVNAPIRGRRIQLPRSPKIIAGLAMLAAFLIVAIIGPFVAPYNPSSSLSTTNGVPQPPSSAHWLGTTQTQQDVFSQLLAGGRSTILVALLAGIAATILSVVIGVWAGYMHGRVTDDFLSMLANFFLVMPALPLLIVIFGFLSPSGASNDVLIGLIIAITGWAWGARVLRAQTLSLRSRDYVESARIIGERGWRVITYEILPNLAPIVASSFLFTVLYGVGTYTALAFLGLVNPEHWSWGSMLFEAQNADAEISGYWWWYIPPGLAVAFLGTSLALLNFGIDEFINPRLRAAGVARRQARKSGGQGLPRRFELGLTPVVRAAPRDRRQHGRGQHGCPQPESGADVMTAQPLLEIRGLRVDYGAGPEAVHAVVDADLVLRRGEVLGLAGESGSGKSTLAYAAIRLLRAPGMITGGEVLYYPEPGRAVDLLDLDEPELRRLRWSQIAVVLQSAMNALNPVMSIGTQLTDVLQAHVPDMDAAARRARAAELLAMVGINADRLGSYPHELSGGMRQRVMIAMALALEPQVVILDEPTTALDVVTQREILEELTALRERLGFAVLFITHDLSLLVETADSIAVMYAGRMVERAAAEELFRAPRHPYTVGLLNSFPALHGPRRYMTGIPGSPPDLRMLPVGCVFHPRCPYATDICREQSPPLEQPASSAADRLASCWLQDGTRPVPGVLAQPEPGRARARRAAPPTQHRAPPRRHAAGQLAPSIAAPEQGSQS